MWDVPERSWGTDRLKGGPDIGAVERYLSERQNYERSLGEAMDAFDAEMQDHSRNVSVRAAARKAYTRAWTLTFWSLAIVAAGLAFVWWRYLLVDWPGLVLAATVGVLWSTVVPPVTRRVVRSREPGPRPAYPRRVEQRLAEAGITRPDPVPTGPIGLDLERWTRICDWFGGCAYCGGKRTSPIRFQIEHVVPQSRGGPHAIGNIVPACASCNGEKLRMLGSEYFEQRRKKGLKVNRRFEEWLNLPDRSVIWR